MRTDGHNHRQVAGDIPNADRDGLGVLGLAPTPEQGARLSLAKISAALKAAGRQRNIDTRAREIHAALHAENRVAPEAVAAAFGATTTAAVHVIAELNDHIVELEAALALAAHFATHPDADIYRSLPGLGVVLGTLVLDEFGTTRTVTPPPSLARTTPEPSPLTVASGKKHAVLIRFSWRIHEPYGCAGLAQPRTAAAPSGRR